MKDFSKKLVHLPLNDKRHGYNEIEKFCTIFLNKFNKV
jgi:hypothetical protein